nr:MAG TPA: hypothetical protein [Caudoviricetes sp.]
MSVAFKLPKHSKIHDHQHGASKVSMDIKNDKPARNSTV